MCLVLCICVYDVKIFCFYPNTYYNVLSQTNKIEGTSRKVQSHPLEMDSFRSIHGDE